MFKFSTDNMIIGGSIIFSFSAVIFLVYMLFRILSEQDKIYQEIRQGTKDLMDAGKKLHSMYAIAEKLSTQHPESPPIETPPLDALMNLSDALLSSGVKKFEGIASDMRALMNSMMSTNPEALLPWRDNNIKLIEKLLAEQKMLSPDISKLQNCIDQVAKDLKRVNYLASSDNDTIKDLNQKLSTYQTMVIQARERSRNAENTVSTLQSEILALNKKINRFSSENVPNTAHLEEEIEKLTNERMTLLRQIDSLTSEINRTNIEKGFIEDKFIELS